MRNLLSVVLGCVLLAVGVVWVLQGIGVVTGSFMTGSKLWFAIGLVVGAGGIALLLRAARTALRR